MAVRHGRPLPRPVLRPHPYFDQPTPLLFAHRGGSREVVENSRAALEHTAALGLTYFETDVHATADGVVVLHHDESLDRMTDTTGPISALTWAEVARVRDASGHAPGRLEDALADYPTLRLNIDAKSDDVVAPLLAIARRHVARVCVASFVDARLARVRIEAPELATSMGQREVAALLALSGLPRRVGVATGARLAAVRSAHCLQVPVRHRGVAVVTGRMLGFAHELGLQVHVWTVDEPSEMRRLLDLGVDGLVTDVPTLAKDVLGGHDPR